MDSIFRELNISTVTINVESNIFFDLNGVLQAILIADTLLKDQKEISHQEYKNQNHPRGTISYVCYKDEWCGVRRKKKKASSKKRNDFVNQVTLDIFIECSRRVNVMIFRNGKIKLAGCKNSNDAIIAVTNIWSILTLNGKECITMTNNLDTSFLFTNEMINISFSFPFVINKIEVNKLFNSKSDCISFYEQTGQQYVNIKMLTGNNKKKAIRMELPLNSLPRLFVVEIDSKNPMKTCFMLFEKRVIMSGVDYTVMEQHFLRFRSVFNDNIHSIKVS
jgi:hypothetical protein